jgi:hypothetical protein
MHHIAIDADCRAGSILLSLPRRLPMACKTHRLRPLAVIGRPLSPQQRDFKNSMAVTFRTGKRPDSKQPHRNYTGRAVAGYFGQKIIANGLAAKPVSSWCLISHLQYKFGGNALHVGVWRRAQMRFTSTALVMMVIALMLVALMLFAQPRSATS